LVQVELPESKRIDMPVESLKSGKEEKEVGDAGDEGKENEEGEEDGEDDGQLLTLRDRDGSAVCFKLPSADDPDADSSVLELADRIRSLVDEQKTAIVQVHRCMGMQMIVGVRERK
jgi:hypothetical protein